MKQPVISCRSRKAGLLFLIKTGSTGQAGKTKLFINCFRNPTYKHMLHEKQNIIIIKKEWQCKGGRGRLTPYQSEDPSPTLPTYRGKEEKGKIVEDKKGESN